MAKKKSKKKAVKKSTTKTIKTSDGKTHKVKIGSKADKKYSSQLGSSKGSSSGSKSIDYTLQKGESVAQYNSRIATARGESAPTSNVNDLSKQLASLSTTAKSLGIDTQTADKMVAQTKAQGSTAFKGSSFDTPNTPVAPVVPPIVPPVEPTQPEAPVAPTEPQPTDPTQPDATQTDTTQSDQPQTPDGVITDPVTGNQYQQDASGTYVPYTGAQTASVGTTSPVTTSSYSGASIVDFLNSSGQASDFGSRSSLAQKYGITNYTGTSAQNTQLLNTLRGASTTSPAQTYAPATVGSSDLTPAPTTGEPTALDMAMSQFGVGFDPASFAMSPQISIQTLIKDLMRATNLPDITKNIDNISSEIEDLANERDDEIRAVNDDPWLTEGVRIQRVDKVNAKYEDRIKNKTAYLTLMQGAYDDARQQAQWVAQTALEQYDTQRRFQFDQLKYWTDQAESQLKAQNDAYLNDRDYELELAKFGLDKYKAEQDASSGGVGGMFSAAQINATVNQIAGAFDNEPIVKNFNILNEGYQFAQSLSDRTTNPADDQALIYAFAKAMDPNSVVREGEYNTVQKYAQSWVKAYGASVQQAIAGTGFLSPSARTNIKQTIGNRYNTSLQNYQNVQSQYQQRIDAAKAGQGNSLTDYSQAYTQQPVQQQQQTQTTQQDEGFWSGVGSWLFGSN